MPIRRIAEVAYGTVIVDGSGDLYLFREGELIGRSILKVSGTESVGICASGRWCGVASRCDRNIVIWDLQGA